MIKFTQNDIKYLKLELIKVMDIWENGTKEELKNYIEDCTCNSLETVLILHVDNDWSLLDRANTDKRVNELVEKFCNDALGIWYWDHIDCETALEVNEYIKNMDYCNLYMSIYHNEENELEVC